MRKIKIYAAAIAAAILLLFCLPGVSRADVEVHLIEDGQEFTVSDLKPSILPLTYMGPGKWIVEPVQADSLTYGNVKERFDEFLKRKNLPRIRFHDLRHLNITGLIAVGADLGTVQKQVGHTSIDTTLSYNHPSFQAQKKLSKPSTAAFKTYGRNRVENEYQSFSTLTYSSAVSH